MPDALDATRDQPSALAVDLAGVRLRNPLLAAAGTCGYGTELAEVLDPRHLGGIVTKSITRRPREGNPPWRLIDVPRGMLNAVGLANVGLDRFLEEKLAAAARLDTVVIGSIAGDCVDDYVEVASRLDERDELPAVELNVSCPNTDDGLQFGEHPDGLRTLLAAVRPALSRTKLFVKLSPNVGDITAMAACAVEAGADAITLINTVAGMAIDVETRKTRLSRGAGGLSGPAVHPIAVRMVHDVHRDVARDANVPIVGLGGVMTWEDAAELILAGATAVGMGTALFVDPRSPIGVGRGLERWVRRQGCASIAELVGRVTMGGA
jgi:dihydroorotate dehydrogenase (NAD+) catalytic subunit